MNHRFSHSCNALFTAWIRPGLPIAATLALIASAADADHVRAPRRHDRDRSVRGAIVDTQVLVDGHRAPLYALDDSDGRRYFEAFRGEEYALRLRNLTGRRIAVLTVVDGLNVLNGERSHLTNHEPMYVLEAWSSVTIRGWRTSLDHVRQFNFVDEERSYSTRSGQANADMGWIRVLAFEEQRALSWHRRNLRLDEDDRLGKSARPQAQGEADAQASPPEKGDFRSRQESEDFPGTGWGRQRHDPVRTVEFEPVATASDHIVLRYEYASGLTALGIFRNRDRLTERDRGEYRFAQPPRW